jgi:Cro/C1-type HTH DNA-binding domain
MMDNMAKFKLHETLKGALDAHDKSITKLAKECKIPVSVLHGWVNGTLPSAKNLHHVIKLSAHLEISIEELLFGLKSSQGQTSNIFTCNFVDGGDKYRLIIQKIQN